MQQSLFEDLIQKHSKEGDIVVDTFLGGGTTAIACKNLNRKFRGCEINKDYYDKIINIIEDKQDVNTEKVVKKNLNNEDKITI